MIQLRLLHPGRHVWRISRNWHDNGLEETWISLRRAPPDWEKIFISILDLIWLANTSQPGHIQLNDQHGFITWDESRRVTKFTVRLEGFSTAKQSLVAAALLKAARFSLLEEE
jgi:hypothetical protein